MIENPSASQADDAIAVSAKTGLNVASDPRSRSHAPPALHKATPENPFLQALIFDSWFLTPTKAS